MSFLDRLSRAVPIALLAGLILASGPALCVTTSLASPQELQATEIEALVKALRQSKDLAAAVGSAEKLRLGGEPARKQLLALSGDSTLSDTALKGVLATLAEKNDRGEGVIAALAGAIAKGDERLAVAVLEALRQYHRQGSVIDALVLELRKHAGSGQRHLIAATASLVVTDPDRQRVTEALVALLGENVEPETAAAIEARLLSLTHQPMLAGVEAWSAWLRDFLTRSQGSFSDRALYEEALRRLLEKQGKDAAARVAEVADAHRRAIDLLVEAKVLPLAYLRPAETPLADVRAHAAQRIVAAAGEDPERVAAATKALIDAVRGDPDAKVRQRALTSLSAVLERASPAEGQAVGAALLEIQILKSPDLGVVREALAVLGKSGHAPAAPPIADLYRSLLAQEDRGRERSLCISALYSLKAESGTIVDAIRDPDREVQKNAVRTLVYIGKPEFAEPVAQVLLDGVAEANVEEFVQTLLKLNNLRPLTVIKALTEAASKPGPGRVPALSGLLRALATNAVPGELEAEVARILRTTYAEGLPDATQREALIVEMERLKAPPLAPIASEWCLGEPFSGHRKRLVSVVTAATPDGAASLRAFGEQLAAKGFFQSASDVLTETIKRAGAAPDDSVVRTELGPARRLQIKVLRALNYGEVLATAEKLIEEELALAPEDGSLLRERGRVRILAGRRAEGIADLRRGLEKEDATLDAAERKECQRLLVRELTEAKELDDARALLGRFPEAERDREVLVLDALLTFEEGRAREAFDLVTAAFALPAPPDDAALYRLQAKFGMSVPDPRIRELAAAAFGRIANGNGVKPEIGARVEADRKIREKVAQLGTADPEASASIESELLRFPADDVALWTVAALGAAAEAPAPQQAVERWLRLLKGLFQDDQALQDIALPTGDNGASDHAEVIAAVKSWWSARTASGD